MNNNLFLHKIIDFQLNPKWKSKKKATGEDIGDNDSSSHDKNLIYNSKAEKGQSFLSEEEGNVVEMTRKFLKHLNGG